MFINPVSISLISCRKNLCRQPEIRGLGPAWDQDMFILQGILFQKEFAGQQIRLEAVIAML
jgi:hypothetical protein